MGKKIKEDVLEVQQIEETVVAQDKARVIEEQQARMLQIKAKQIIEEAKNEAIRRCSSEIQVVLDKYNCRMEPRVVISRSGTSVELNVMANE